MSALDPRAFTALEKFLKRVPAITGTIGFGSEGSGWWTKFQIDIEHPLAWRVVQEFGHVVNYLSMNERLPAVFKPVSPPPYLNGGPGEFLSWVIECNEPAFKPGTLAKWLEERLPKPVDDESEWTAEDDDDDE